MTTPSSPEPEAERVAETARDIARRLYDQGMRCNCDFDRWQPERSTGHSCVCRIHKAAMTAHLETTR